MEKIKTEVEKLMKELDITVTPEILEVVEVSPELPSGGSSHCSGNRLTTK